MAGNTRGRLKEQFEGVHNNFVWVQKHLEGALELIQEHNPKLTGSVKLLHEQVTVLDELANNVYAGL